MPESSNGRGVLTNLSMTAVIQITTIIVMFAGNWFIISERLEANRVAVVELREKTREIDQRMNALDRDLATLNVRIENMREIIAELRRQSNLRTPPRQ